MNARNLRGVVSNTSTLVVLRLKREIGEVLGFRATLFTMHYWVGVSGLSFGCIVQAGSVCIVGMLVICSRSTLSLPHCLNSIAVNLRASLEEKVCSFFQSQRTAEIIMCGEQSLFPTLIPILLLRSPLTYMKTTQRLFQCRCCHLSPPPGRGYSFLQFYM